MVRTWPRTLIGSRRRPWTGTAAGAWRPFFWARCWCLFLRDAFSAYLCAMSGVRYRGCRACPAADPRWSFMREMLMWFCLVCQSGRPLRVCCARQRARAMRALVAQRASPIDALTYGCQSLGAAGFPSVLHDASGRHPAKPSIRKKRLYLRRTQPLRRIFAAPSLHEQLRGRQSYCTY